MKLKVKSISLCSALKSYKIFSRITLNYIYGSFGSEKNFKVGWHFYMVCPVGFSIVDKVTLNFLLLIVVQRWFNCIICSNGMLQESGLGYLDLDDIEKKPRIQNSHRCRLGFS